MSPIIEILDLVLYCLQQVGVMLGIGCATLLLFIHAASSRNGAIEKDEDHLLVTIKRVVWFSIICIITSGVAITLLHVSADQLSTVFQPAFLMKWFFIGIVTVCASLDSKNSTNVGIVQGLSGGTWVALFIIHILAPIATWLTLGLAYGAWMLCFMACWLGYAALRNSTNAHGGVMAPAAPPAEVKSFEPGPSYVAAKPPLVSTPPIVPVPVAAAPVDVTPQPSPSVVVPVSAYPPRTSVQPQQPPLQPIIVSELNEAYPYRLTTVEGQPILHPHLTEQQEMSTQLMPLTNSESSLPAIRVMPQKPEDLTTQHRSPLVKFG